MTQQHKEKGQDVTAGKGRRDEVGKTGIYPISGPFPEGDAPIITPADINESHDTKTPGVHRSEDLKGAERLPRKGDDTNSDLRTD
jgi:hypothetical protein